MPERHNPLFFHWEYMKYLDQIQKEFGCNMVCAAILLALYASNLPLSYSRRKAFYASPQRYLVNLFTYAAITRAMDFLGERNFIYHHRMQPGNFGWQSWAELTEASRTIISRITNDDLTALKPSETIILRGVDKRLIDYSDSSRTRSMRRNIAALNEMLMACRLTGCRACPVYRIFNQNFDRGGRFYSAGGWQNLPKQSRADLKIDGQSVCEIDFKALHPSLIYLQAGHSLPDDPYEIGSWPRAIVKRSFLTLLNAKNYQSARLAIANSEQMASFSGGALDRHQSLAGKLIEDIKARHWRISNAFHSDCGARLMRLDSDLAEVILMRLHEKGLPVLPVHDSFMIGSAYAGELEEAMHFAAAKSGFPGLQTAKVA